MSASQGRPVARSATSRRQLLAGYVAVVALTGGAVAVGALLRVDLSQGLEPAFVLVGGLLLVSELWPLLTAGSRDGAGLVLSTTMVFALLLRYGLPAALLLQVLATVVGDLAHRKQAWRLLFNVGQYTLSWTTAAAVMQLAGHQAGLGSPLALSGGDLLPAALGAVTYFVVNELLVVRALTLYDGGSVAASLRADAAYESLTSAALLALSPLVCLAMARGAAFVPLLLPPLVAVYAVGAVALDREQQALSDALTGLPNRTRFAQRAAAALLEGPVALVLFDLDRFKEVNDTLGHHVGDRLLEVVAQRLREAVRDCDTVARLGGDEFALVLPGMASGEVARQAAERLRETVCAPIVLEGLLLDVGASAGIAVSPADGTDTETLLQHADVAMYLSKESGHVEVYDPARDRNSTSRLAMLGELRRALDGDELELHYQPSISMAGGEVVGVEALVRWRHPALGLLPPDEFVPLAERSGLVQALTAWVLDAALAQLARWHAMGLPLRLAVNVSVKDLCGGELADEVDAGLARYGVPAGTLMLEVTEGSLLADPVRAAATLRRLQELGVALSLDDFGTGYSSLSYLRRLPVRELKVDRSFISAMEDPRDLAVVRSIVELGRGLGMTVVAEGVEDALAFHRLAAMGCDVAQGWFLSRALPAEELTPWLQERAGLLPAAAAV